MTAQPAQFTLPFTHYASLGYNPCPTIGKDPQFMGKGWYDRQFTAEEYAGFDARGYNVGLRCSNVVGIDIDVDDERLAKKVEACARKTLGLPKGAPVRVGSAPKRLLVARVNEPVKGFDITSGSGKDRRTLFQLLGSGKQFVIHGMHPGTGKPYTLSAPLPKQSALKLVTADDLARLRDALLDLFAEEGIVTGSTRRGAVRATGKWSNPAPWTEVGMAQAWEALEGLDPDMLGDVWTRVGYALHDGTHGSDEGLEMWDAWSSNAQGTLTNGKPRYEPGQCAKRWRGFKPGGGTSCASLFKNDWPKLDAGSPHEPPVRTLSDDYGEAVQSSLDIARDIMDVMNGSFAPCEAIIEGLLYPRGVTMFYGKQKEGKSFALMQVAAAVASGATLWSQSPSSLAKGKPFEGFAVRRPDNVLMLCSEDHGARLQRRFKELLHSGALPMPKAKLKLLLREDIARLVNAYVGEDGTIPEGHGLKIIEELIREWAAAGIKVIVFDTVDNIEAMFNVEHVGNNIKRREYAQGTFYDKLADELDIAIVGTGHLRKGKGKVDAELDAMDLVNTTGAANAGISHFWAFTKLGEQARTIEEGDKGKERRFYATGREIEFEPSLHFMQGVDGMGGLWVNMGRVSDHEVGKKAHEYLSALEALLEETGEKFITAEEIAKACNVKANTMLVFLKRFKARDLTWKNGKRLVAERGRSGGWTLV